MSLNVDLAEVAAAALQPYGIAKPQVIRGALSHPELFVGAELIDRVLDNQFMVETPGMIGLFEDQQLLDRDKLPLSYTSAGIRAHRAGPGAAQFRGLQRLAGPIRDVCYELLELSEGAWSRVHAIAFDTADGAAALGRHTDCHPVINIQSAETANGGAPKLWTLFDPPWATADEALAHYHSRKSRRVKFIGDHEVDLSTQQDIILYPEDMIILPPYWVHEAFALGGRSLSISIPALPEALTQKYPFITSNPSFNMDLIQG